MKQEKGTINRSKYKEIKRYDHKQMEEFLTRVYTQGLADGIQQGVQQQDLKDKEQEWFENGVKESRAMFIKVMDKTLDNTKGIGEKLKAAIVENFNIFSKEHCENILGARADGNE